MKDDGFCVEIAQQWVKEQLPKRVADSHKGTYGTTLLVCGSYGMAGAVYLCAKGALRSGAGLVKVAVPHSVYPILAPILPEAVFLPLPETEQGHIALSSARLLENALQSATAVVVGCGLGQYGEATDLVSYILDTASCPVILDADGINAVSLHILEQKTGKVPLVLTPHPGEMARLLGISVSEVQQNRYSVATAFSERYGVTLALKGHHTLVASPEGDTRLCTAGNPGMATGGSGDVLAGIIGSLTGQGILPPIATAVGVWIHATAGDFAAKKLSMHSMLPSDMTDELSSVFSLLEE